MTGPHRRTSLSRVARGLSLLLAAAVLATPGIGDAPAVGSSAGAGAASTVVLPTPDLPWDYQIGGAFPPADGVGIVARDRTAQPSPDHYNICYVNAFQTQRGERRFWTGLAER